MGILEKVGETGKGVVDKAKNMGEIGNLNRNLVYEQERIQEIYAEIGKKYYETRPTDMTPLDALCDDIDTRKRRIKRMHYEIDQMRGIKRCEKCGTEVDEKFMFCGVCGAKLFDPAEDAALEEKEKREAAKAAMFAEKLSAASAAALK